MPLGEWCLAGVGGVEEEVEMGEGARREVREGGGWEKEREANLKPIKKCK